ncbi:MAG: M28 family peptidase [Candidatus Hydrogenedentes bacterium]|nr:M28 family peptidase [Candidatus Hydrogenedentota bacterium]
MSAYLPEQNSASIVSPAAPKDVAKENASFLTRRRFAIASVVMLVFMAGLAHWLSLPPRPLSSSAPAEVFSAERALKHIEVMAQEVHPAGSKENEEVFAYICSQLDAMGIAYVVHTLLRAGNHDLTITRAVLARIPGTAPTKAFAIDGHFDSTPYGPGAADDVSACAAMLETARALKAGPPLMNDIILCFTDMEEEGTLGAWAVTQHPWFEEIGVMLGLEARGTSGPVHMFETSQQNGWLIQELARAGVQPRASSIMFDVYEAMPFGSDFSTRYKKRCLAIILPLRMISVITIQRWIILKLLAWQAYSTWGPIRWAWRNTWATCRFTSVRRPMRPTSTHSARI